MKEHFQYELTPIPTSLFVDDSMRKSNKAQLIQHLFGKDFQLVDPANLVNTEASVIDGGALLGQITWGDKSLFADIVESYRRFTKSKYGVSSVVFDGYNEQQTTKDHEHAHRCRTKSHNFSIKEDTIPPSASNQFSAMATIKCSS